MTKSIFSLGEVLGCRQLGSLEDEIKIIHKENYERKKLHEQENDFIEKVCDHLEYIRGLSNHNDFMGLMDQGFLEELLKKGKNLILKEFDTETTIRHLENLKDYKDYPYIFILPKDVVFNGQKICIILNNEKKSYSNYLLKAINEPGSILSSLRFSTDGND